MKLPKNYPIRVHISTAFCSLLLLIAGSIIWIDYLRTSAMVQESTLALAQRSAQTTGLAIDNSLVSGQAAVRLLARQVQPSLKDLESNLTLLPEYAEVLRSSSSVVSVYSADQLGSYFLVRHLLEPSDHALFSAPQGATFVVQHINRSTQPAQAQYVYFDERLQKLGHMDAPQALSFDPRQRPWFKLAQSRNDTVMTTPYQFFTSHKLGFSLAQTDTQSKHVLGVDIRLDTVRQMLTEHRPTPHSRVMLLDAQRQMLVGDSQPAAPSEPFLTALRNVPIAGLTNTRLTRIHMEQSYWYAGTIELTQTSGNVLYLAIAVPEEEMLAGARSSRDQALLLSLLFVLLGTGLSFWLSRKIAHPLTLLARGTEAMRSFNFRSALPRDSHIDEVDTLSQTLQLTQSTLDTFLNIIDRLAKEDDFQLLMPTLLQSTAAAAHADGGLLFMVEPNARDLKLVAAQWQGIARELPPDARINAIENNGQQVLTSGLSTQVVQDPIHLDWISLPSCQALLVPLFTRDRHPVGVLVLLKQSVFQDSQVRFIEAMSGFAAMALETRELIAQQKELFNAFIRMMAGAIDAKSPYTGGHCARVPELSKMLAQAGCEQSTGPFAEFSMTDDTWEALHVASWLHDCGKVTTPEYVVDKATKLETLYDRIHEIRMRFEVLKRDALISSLQSELDGTPNAVAQETYRQQCRMLDQEFAFVAQCNQGTEFMRPEHMERLKQIAQRTWLRTLSDRLGISSDEARRHEDTTTQALPVLEKLLDDKPVHRIPRETNLRRSGLGSWGFTMQEPDLLYNQGELSNLLIDRGTLTAEERYKINEHIIQTIVMLQALPFPKHLAQVPEIAGNHHERMDGSGYPRGLKGEEMSHLARMMAVADVLEALTASDRPYKPAKTLSQSIKIMTNMAAQGHLDPDWLDLLKHSDVLWRYAAQFLKPEQIDLPATPPVQ